LNFLFPSHTPGRSAARTARIQISGNVPALSNSPRTAFHALNGMARGVFAPGFAPAGSDNLPASISMMQGRREGNRAAGMCIQWHSFGLRGRDDQSSIVQPVKPAALQIIRCVSLSSLVRGCETMAIAPLVPPNRAAFSVANTKS
jgi:hypothetical protein